MRAGDWDRSFAEVHVSSARSAGTEQAPDMPTLEESVENVARDFDHDSGKDKGRARTVLVPNVVDLDLVTRAAYVIERHREIDPTRMPILKGITETVRGGTIVDRDLGTYLQSCGAGHPSAPNMHPRLMARESYRCLSTSGHPSIRTGIRGILYNFINIIAMPAISCA